MVWQVMFVAILFLIYAFHAAHYDTMDISRRPSLGLEGSWESNSGGRPNDEGPPLQIGKGCPLGPMVLTTACLEEWSKDFV